MDKRRFNKKELDAIGKTLVAGSAVPETKIDEIVGKADLFAGILQRIADDKVQAAAAPQRSFVPQYTAAFASVFVMIAAVFGTYRYIQINSSSNSNSSDFRAAKQEIVQDPAAVPVAARPVFPPKEENTGRLSPGRATDQEPLAEKTAFRTPVRSAGKTRQPGNTGEEDAHFYPVSYNGGLEESASGGRVIRVNMTRSALFALGVNVPLENGSETVKADLLVGADGVTRAVRVVE